MRRTSGRHYTPKADDAGCYNVRMEHSRVLAERLVVAADLWEAGVAIRRQSIRRDHPQASETDISRLVGDWLQQRPGAEAGDGPQQGS
jgi:hypothetical protein